MFCGKLSPAKHHKEDVLPKWIAREFPGVWRSVFGHSGPTFAKRDEFGIVSRGPCTQCNNGWMSRLEAVVKPILLPLMKGTASELTPDQQRIISTWLVQQHNNTTTALPNKSRLPKNSSVCLINHFANGERLGKRQILDNAQRPKHLLFFKRQFTIEVLQKQVEGRLVKLG